MHKLFIYGTLKRGYPNHNGYLKDEKYLGEFQTTECYPLLIANKWFAAVMLLEPGVGERVRGELYLVNDCKLSDLDQLEHTHHSKGYRRVEIEIQNIDSQELVCAFTYMKERLHVKDVSSGYLSEYMDRRYIPMHKRKNI